jgi:CubicO group peptidase (beta-lactamase class C family)
MGWEGRPQPDACHGGTLLRTSLRLALGAALLPGGVGAQSLALGRLPPDILIEVARKPYTIDGGSSQRILEQLVLRGPGRAWTSFPFFFLWEPRYEELRLSLRDVPSGRCRVERFQARAAFEAIYPDWQAPPDVPGTLLEAWTAFQETIDRQWTERRDAIVRFLTELRRDVLRTENACGYIQNDVQALVDTRLAAFNAAEEQLVAAGNRTQLQWPPPGFAERLAVRSPPQAPPAPQRAMPLPTPPVSVSAVPRDLADAVERDLGERTDGIVVGLFHSGELRYLDAVERQGPSGSAPLTTDARLAFRGLTPLFVATFAGALESAGALDFGAPISTYLAGIDESIGRITLAQLLAHRSGIDNAGPREGESWEEALGRLDARALFTDPGAVSSYSAYDDLLTIRVIEAVVGLPLGEALGRTLFAPLGMTDTSLGESVAGVPVTITTVLDVLQFIAAWLDGEVRGAPELPRAVADIPPTQARRLFLRGAWYDRVGEHVRVSLVCRGAGFQVFPATNTVFVLFTRGGWPTGTASYLLNELGVELGVGEEILRPTEVRGAAITPADEHCTEPEELRHLVTEPGPDAEAEDWAGRYTNGDRLFLLEDRGGYLKVPGENILDVGHYGADEYFASLRGRPILHLRLIRDGAGRRYLVLDGRAYIHDGDRPEPGSR